MHVRLFISCFANVKLKSSMQSSYFLFLIFLFLSDAESEAAHTTDALRAALHFLFVKGHRSEYSQECRDRVVYVQCSTSLTIGIADYFCALNLT